MEYLKNKLISIAFLFITLSLYGQSYNYVYTDPCTLVSKTVTIPNPAAGVAVNYFGNVKTFTSADFSSGAFDAWISAVAQMNSSSPCQAVTTTLVAAVNNTTVANTLSVVTSVVAVSSVAQTLSSVTTGTVSAATSGVTSTASSIPTPSVPDTSSTASSSTGGGGNLSNSVSNATDGGSSDAGSSSGNSGGESKSSGGGGSTSKSKSTQATKGLGSLIASGDIVAISNTDHTQNFKIVGSITHANTAGTRIKGILLNYTTGSNALNATIYKSWINKSRKLNTVAANTFMGDLSGNVMSTTTVLESYKVNKRFTGMFGLNFTVGKMGARPLLNLSSVGGIHTTFKVNDRIGSSLLVLGVYSPFTQYFEGSWWNAGVLFVPFNSWDIKISKNFKYNISFTGVYELNKSFLNYQILTGGKINF